MQTIVKQNIISLRSNGQHCLCTIWHSGLNRAWFGHLNVVPVLVLFHLLKGYLSNRMLSSARQQQGTDIPTPRRALAMPEQGDLTQGDVTSHKLTLRHI